VADQSKCDERDKLQRAYQEAVSLWMKLGGTDPNTMHLPRAAAAKEDVDEIAAKLSWHRWDHNC
jgi:hypothetical protein